MIPKCHKVQHCAFWIELGGASHFPICYPTTDNDLLTKMMHCVVVLIKMNKIKKHPTVQVA